jgi:diguanylate cyclase (GGDEF)-like protein
MPVRGTGAGEVLGTFAFYADRERLPTPAELDLLEGAARLATIAVELDRTRRDLVDLAESDPLTGLPNRASLSRRLQARLDIARHDEPVAVLFCDLDRFKLVNDSLGHAAGDMVLVDVARRLRDATRPGDLVARLGGDEFVVVPAGPVDEAAAHRLAARVRDALGAPAPAGAPPHLVGASIGIAVAAGGSASEVLRRADSAMYVAKVGRHDVAVHDVAVDARRSDELRLRDALAGALDRGELRLVYQPVLDLPTGRVRGFEALVRWRHPELGDVPPARFVPLAEEHGLIRTIGAWVLDTALHDAAGWPEVGGAPLSVSVNLSCEQLGEPELADAVLAATAQAGVDPSRLRLEVTETAVLRDEDAARGTLRRLRAAGIAVDLDDFGTGLSSLTRLRTLPIDAVKLDCAFTGELGPDGDGALVEGVVALARGLGIEVVAEGVEAADHVTRLVAVGCTAAQGRHLGAPMPARRVAAWLAGARRTAPAAAAIA